MFDEFYELGNGCICCSVRDDLVNTLERLLERKDKFDYILVETTGLANPGPVASTFWVDDELDSHIFLDGVVTVVDVKHILRHLDEKRPDGPTEAQMQVAYADCLLLNKQDLVTPEESTAVEARLKEFNTTAKLLRTTKSSVPLDEILNIGAFSFARVNALPEVVDAAAADPDTHSHSSAVSSVCIKAKGIAVDVDLFTRWIGGLLWEPEPPLEVYRSKGVINAAGSDAKHILQAVHELFDCQPSSEAWAEPVSD